MNSLLHSTKLILAGFKLSFRSMYHFSFSSALSILSNLVYIGLFILFWQTLLQRIGPVPGWSLGEMVIYLAFAEFFHAIVGGVGGLAIKAYLYIINGRLDVLLTRPADPRLMFIVFGINLEGLVRSIPSVIILLIIAIQLGAKINAFSIFIGFWVSMLAGLSLILLHLSGSFLSFWVGSVKAVEELVQSIEALINYPLTILDGTLLRIVFTILLPIGYAATEPALAGLMKTNPVVALGGASFLLVLWLGINEIIWRKGMSIYESYGG